jgi:hypothetical protein
MFWLAQSAHQPLGLNCARSGSWLLASLRTFLGENEYPSGRNDSGRNRPAEDVRVSGFGLGQQALNDYRYPIIVVSQGNLVHRA